jgi:hypothetical protein
MLQQQQEKKGRKNKSGKATPIKNQKEKGAKNKPPKATKSKNKAIKNDRLKAVESQNNHLKTQNKPLQGSEKRGEKKGAHLPAMRAIKSKTVHGKP